jgi:hypothetical protein
VAHDVALDVAHYVAHDVTHDVAPDMAHDVGSHLPPLASSLWRTFYLPPLYLFAQLASTNLCRVR